MNSFVSFLYNLKFLETCLLRGLGKILNEKYLFLWENSEVFLTKSISIPEIKQFYFEKDQKKLIYNLQYFLHFYQIINLLHSTNK